MSQHIGFFLASRSTAGKPLQRLLSGKREEGPYMLQYVDGAFLKIEMHTNY